MKTDWLYLYINKDGVLVTVDGYKIFTDCPVFNSVESAEKWLEENDERANCLGFLI